MLSALKKQNGFTLIELMVYIAIVGIVVLVAGQAFSDSTKFRVRSQSMLKAAESAKSVASLVREDLAQMGAKTSFFHQTAGSDDFATRTEVYMDAENSDFSSYKLNSGSDIVFRHVRYNEYGEYDAVEEVRWYLEGDNLKRRCKNISGKAADDCTTEGVESVIADGVSVFKVVAAKPGVVNGNSSILFPAGGDKFRLIARTDGADYKPVTVEPVTGGSSVNLSGLVSNYNYTQHKEGNTKYKNQVFVASSVDALDEGDSWQSCFQIALKKEVEYEIGFEMSLNRDASRSFVPGKDHMAVGFRDAENGAKQTGLEDYLFYPPTSDKGRGKRAVRFAPKSDFDNACIVFTLSTFSPVAHGGLVSINSLYLKKVEYANYEFDASFTHETLDKKNVKAFQVELVVEKNGEQGRVVDIVATPSNGLEG
ncbi:MAG: prepilin-type N-terminal cleavage/methylation domain-containing protein [Fibrobacteraceae bacterium]|nr:prepilin-type N-terminal cleavage/methylation domain-containing protein [Fibrobacteraceae bacterium]